MNYFTFEDSKQIYIKGNYKLSSNILINVLDIYLDTENPRHDPINEQAEIIHQLVTKERVKILARHIAINGVNPLDLIGVIKDKDGNYIVVEGNRRLCSLLLLNDPERAPSGDSKYFKKLSDNSNKIPLSVNCVLFEDYEEAKEWMIVRHDGEQEGVGVRKWDPEAKTRNNAKNDRRDSNALTISLLDYAAEQGYLPKNRENKIVTTASRYLGNPFFRKVFGIESARSEKNVYINVPCNEFNVMCEKFCQDLLQNTLVNSRSSKMEWEQYAMSFGTQGLAPTHMVKPYPLSECPTEKTVASNADLNVDDPEGVQNQHKESVDDKDHSPQDMEQEHTEEASAKKNQRQTQDPDKRKFIFPADFNPRINSKILRRVFREIKCIDIDTNTLAVSFLTRAFLENVYKMFHEATTGNYPGEKTNDVLLKVVTLLAQEKGLTKEQENALGCLRRVQSRTDNPLSPKTLGANVHLGSYPDSFSLKREFDNIAPILEVMITRI